MVAEEGGREVDRFLRSHRCLQSPKHFCLFHIDPGANHLVSVPTHFYKVVLGVGGGGTKVVLGAFLMPNEIIPEDMPLEKFVVPVEWIEKVTFLLRVKNCIVPHSHTGYRAHLLPTVIIFFCYIPPVIAFQITQQGQRSNALHNFALLPPTTVETKRPEANHCMKILHEMPFSHVIRQMLMPYPLI